ncbi:uncharacterized protein [Ciconia boyciana]|uniref:uncharacterized protein n=1 Tax=Ciconia boyciana TaxID=52775 RepID=UPI003BA0DE7F
MPATRQQKRKTAAAGGGEDEEEGGAEKQRAGRNPQGRRAAGQRGQAGADLAPAHAYVQIITARLCAESERSRRGKPGAGGGKAPQPPAAAASPVLSPGRRRSGAQAKRLVGRGSPPSGGGGGFTAPGGRRSASRAATRAPSRPPRRGRRLAIATQRARRRLRAHAGRPTGLCPVALLLLLLVAGGRCPAGKRGELLPRRQHRPARTTAQPARWVGMCARVWRERERVLQTHARERERERYAHAQVNSMEESGSGLLDAAARGREQSSFTTTIRLSYFCSMYKTLEMKVWFKMNVCKAQNPVSCQAQETPRGICFAPGITDVPKETLDNS